MLSDLRAVIIDDEPPARARLRRLLDRLGGVVIVDEGDSVGSGFRCIRMQRPQLVFLDIALGKETGFHLLQRLPAPWPMIVFTTAYHEHAVRAFEIAAVDYLLKPFDAERLARTLHRVRERLGNEGDEAVDERFRHLRAALPEQPRLLRLVVHERGRSRIISIDEVLRFSAAGNYVEVNTASSQHLIRASLSRLVQGLDPRRWIRVHRSHVVRVDFIASTKPCGHGDLLLCLRDGSELMLTRRHRKHLPADLL